MQEQLEQALRVIKELETENRLLRQKVDLLIRRLFASKSEKIDPKQLLLEYAQMLDAEAESKDPEPDPDNDSPRPKGRKRKKRSEKLPEDLPTEEVVIEPEEVKEAPNDYVCIGEETREELDVEPQRYIRRIIRRPRYVKKSDRSLPPVIAPAPKQLIDGSYATPGLLTYILINRYMNHLPLYRQEQMFKRDGIDISRKTMTDWLIKVADWFSLIYDRMKKELVKGHYVQADETPIKYLEPGRGSCGRGYLWVYNQPGGSIVYEWHASRAAECLNDILQEFNGIVQTDGYAAYRSFAKQRREQIARKESNKPIDLAACWAHARRKFIEAEGEAPGFRKWILHQISHLYRIEQQLREKGHGPALRHVVRKGESQMITQRIKRALKLKWQSYLPQSYIGKAISYTLSFWDELELFIEKGEVEIDNNLVENAIRPTALGKKNWLFFGSKHSGRTGAIIYTLIENCKRLGINPRDYFEDVLSRLPSMNTNDLDQLLPANWLAETYKSAANF